MSSSSQDDFPLDPFIEEQRFEEPPPQAPAALGKMLALWRGFAANGEVPHRGQFDTLTLRPWLGHVMIYEAVDGGRDFRNRLEGSEVVMLTGEDWTGRCASEVDAQFGSRMLEYMQESGEDRPALHARDVDVPEQRRPRDAPDDAGQVARRRAGRPDPGRALSRPHLIGALA
jgi:hypothetical protein